MTHGLKRHLKTLDRSDDHFAAGRSHDLLSHRRPLSQPRTERGYGLASCQQIVIELHDGESNGRRTSVDEMIAELVQRHGFHQVDQYGLVCVFERRPQEGHASGSTL